MSYKYVKRNSGFFGNGVNVIMVVCCKCGKVYEEDVLGVNSDYESVSVCEFCGCYNSI